VILEQDYPEFEVIVVNDHSRDETELLLHAWQKRFAHLRVINLTAENANMRGKKFAISMGIKGAKHESLVFTDADCHPKSKHWLSHMAIGLTEPKKIVLGFGGFEKKQGLFNKLIGTSRFTLQCSISLTLLQEYLTWEWVEIWHTIKSCSLRPKVLSNIDMLHLEMMIFWLTKFLIEVTQLSN
jgi:cellulose synthase/poly-beta-1,6-N-acetylglucosamine synthase-like glycosyltransferase